MSDLQTRFHLDGDGDDLTVEHVQDVAPILERNAQLRAAPQRSEWGRWVASIPNVIIMKWMNEAAARGHHVLPFTREFDEIVARKLEDPEWAYLRVDRQANQFRTGWGK